MKTAALNFRHARNCSSILRRVILPISSPRRKLVCNWYPFVFSIINTTGHHPCTEWEPTTGEREEGMNILLNPELNRRPNRSRRCREMPFDEVCQVAFRETGTRRMPFYRRGFDHAPALSRCWHPAADGSLAASAPLEVRRRRRHLRRRRGCASVACQCLVQTWVDLGDWRRDLLSGVPRRRTCSA